jgi:hypothetical protein
MNINFSEDIRHRPDVIRFKRRIGTIYGMTTGLAFAAASWGTDGYLINQANAFYPWLKFIIGAVICIAAGALAGWFVARSEKAFVGLPVYLLLGFLFAWLVMALPFQIFPNAVTSIDPEVGNKLNYTIYEGFSSRFWIAFFWIALFVSLVGLLQIPLAEPAAFSTSRFGLIAPLLVCSVVMLINGFIVDRLNNEALRSALINMDKTIQFTVDHQGQEVDRVEARQMRMSSLRAVQEVIAEPRQLIVGSYDQYLDQIHVLVHFGTTWTDCVVV